MLRHCICSKNLDSLLEELAGAGHSAKIREERQLTYFGKIKVERWLKVQGEGIVLSLYPTKAFVLLEKGIDKLQDRDKDLLEWVKKKYTLPIDRYLLALYSFLAGAFAAYVLGF